MFYGVREKIKCCLISVLQRSGIAFPQRSANAPPIFTPPVARSELTSAYHQSGVGAPIATSVSLNTAMASDTGNLRCVIGINNSKVTSDTYSHVLCPPLCSLSDFSRIRDMIELLREMLQAVNPNDREVGVDFSPDLLHSYMTFFCSFMVV